MAEEVAAEAVPVPWGGDSVDGVRGVRRGGSGGVDGRRPPLPSIRMLLKRRGGMR